MAQADRKYMVLHRRVRVAIADVNAGYSLVPATPGLAHRLVDCIAIAVGGAVATVTTVDVIGTLSASTRKLVAFAQASLTQSAALRAGASGATLLADGASFTQNDVNTALTAGKTGSDAATATHIDFLISYTSERP